MLAAAADLLLLAVPQLLEATSCCSRRRDHAHRTPAATAMGFLTADRASVVLLMLGRHAASRLRPTRRTTAQSSAAASASLSANIGSLPRANHAHATGVLRQHQLVMESMTGAPIEELGRRPAGEDHGGQGLNVIPCPSARSSSMVEEERPQPREAAIMSASRSRRWTRRELCGGQRRVELAHGGDGGHGKKISNRRRPLIL